nr:putative interleukin binding protein [Oriental turtle dovepox virus]
MLILYGYYFHEPIYLLKDILRYHHNRKVPYSCLHHIHLRNYFL